MGEIILSVTGVCEIISSTCPEIMICSPSEYTFLLVVNVNSLKIFGVGKDGTGSSFITNWFLVTEKVSVPIGVELKEQNTV